MIGAAEPAVVDQSFNSIIGAIKSQNLKPCWVYQQAVSIPLLVRLRENVDKVARIARKSFNSIIGAIKRTLLMQMATTFPRFNSIIGAIKSQ